MLKPILRQLKHGPLALVDHDMPVVAIAPNNDLIDKLKSNLQEVRARAGVLYVFADHKVLITPELPCSNSERKYFNALISGANCFDTVVITR